MWTGLIALGNLSVTCKQFRIIEIRSAGSERLPPDKFLYALGNQLIKKAMNYNIKK
jgi:hypothetical protein